MNGFAEGQLLARHWRTFLPVWLTPVPILVAIVLGDFASAHIVTRVLPYFVAVAIVYIVIVQIPPLGLWRRGEITYLQMFWLSAPMALVAIVCIIAGTLLHAARG